MSTVNLQDVHDHLVPIADRAGDMITSATPSPAGSGIKKNSADLVTETDQAVERMVSTARRERFPDSDFMGEETYQPGDRLTDHPTFVVDPIDGTTSFFHRHPYVCVSLGLAVGQKPVVGVVYNPFTKQLYTGFHGQGSFLTDATRGYERARLPLREPEAMEDLSHCLVAVKMGQ